MSHSSRNTPATDDLTAVSPTGRAIAKHLREQKGNDNRQTVERPVSQQMLNDMGATQHYKVEEEGRIKFFLIGSRRVILTASIYDYLIEEAIRSHPARQPALKLDRPLSRRWRERREAQKASKDARLPTGRVVKEKRATRKARQDSAAVQQPLGKPPPRLPPLA
jgi:hypothetical protein